MADIEGQVPAEEVPQQDAADVAPVTAEEPQIEEQQQDPVQQVADAPTSEPAEEPVAATEQAPAAEETPVDASAAAAAAAAVAARLMASHGQSSDFPVSSGAEHAYGDGNNKRPRDDEAAIDGEGPDKKRASTGLLDGQNGTEAHNPGGPMETLEIPANMVGKLIGKGGETIRNLQLNSDTRIQVDHSGEGDNKRVTITGMTGDAVAKCKREIMEIIHDEEVKEEIDCPAGIVGRIIGRGGETIRALQSASQAHITVDQNFPEGHPRKIIIQGRAEACRRASTMVSELINGEPGSAQAIIQRVCQEYGIGKTHVVFCPKGMVGRIIGRQGDTIKQIQRQTGATVQIDQGGDPCRVTIAGQPSSADNAKRMIDDIVAGMDPLGGRPDSGRQGPGGQGGYPPFGGPGGFPPAFGGFPPYGGAPPFGGFPPYGAPFGAPFGGPPAGFGQFGGADPYAQQGGYGQGGYGGGGGGAGGGYGGPQSGGAAPGGGGSSGLWQELHDDQGRPYYYNTQTGVTQWEKPADF